MAGKMGKSGSISIIFKADLTKYVSHRPGYLWWIIQPGANIGGIGLGLLRMVRPWNEWQIVWGYDIEKKNHLLPMMRRLQFASSLLVITTLK